MKGARADTYDVVVIGAGIGGLTAGALLARAGKEVLIVEAEVQPGGYARALRRGAYTFDLAGFAGLGMCVAALSRQAAPGVSCGRCRRWRSRPAEDREGKAHDRDPREQERVPATIAKIEICSAMQET